MTSRSDFPLARRDAVSRPGKRSSTRSLAAFVDAARRKPSVDSDVTDWLESLAVVLTAEQAARIGKKLTVTTAVEEP